MPTPSQFLPPADGSGGYLTVAIAIGNQTYKSIVHVPALVSGGTTYNTASSTYPATANEPSPVDTFHNLYSLAANLYPSGTVITLVSYTPIVAGLPSLTGRIFYSGVSVTGTGTTGTGGLAAQGILNFRTTGGEKARVVIPQCTAWESNGTVTTDGTYSPTGQSVPVQALYNVAAYAGGVITPSSFTGYNGATGIYSAMTGRDGKRLSPQAHVTFPLNRRYRRHFKLA